MRILFLHEVGYLEKPIFEMHEFPEYLASRGHTIGFIDFLEQRPLKAELRFGREIRGRVVDSAKIQLFSQRSSIPGVLGRIITVFTFPVFFLRVIRQFAPDAVVSFSVPTSGWQAAILCKVLRIPFVFRALDVSHKIRATMLAPLVKFAERVVYSQASHVSCNNPALLSYCSSLGANSDRSSVDFPPLDVARFPAGPKRRNEIRAELGISQNERVILYMGSFFYFSGLDHVLQCLSNIEAKPRLVLIGGGEQDAYLRSRSTDLGLNEQVTFTGFVDFARLSDFLSIADVAINPMVPSLVSDVALPNKVLQYMAAGLPVVTTRLAGLHALFPDEPGIIFVEHSEIVLERALGMLERREMRSLGIANRAAVAKKFGIESSVDRFEKLLWSVVATQ